MGNTCTTNTTTELDIHIDRFHKNRLAPTREPYEQHHTYFTTDDDQINSNLERGLQGLQKETLNYNSQQEKPVQRMSRLLEPIAVQRQKINYLERI